MGLSHLACLDIPRCDNAAVANSGTMVKAFEIRKKSPEELYASLDELKAELSRLRVAKVTGGVASKLSKIKVVRKDIARVLTVINQNKRAALREHYKGAKYVPTDLRYKKTRAIRRRLTKNEAQKKTVKEWKRSVNFPQRKF